LAARDIRYARASDGVRIAYLAWGEGPPIIGSVQSPFVEIANPLWELPEVVEAMEAMFAGYRLLLYDTRGGGSSDRLVADLSQQGFLRDVDAVATAESLDRFGLYGANLNGAIASAYAAAHPERVTCLVLHDANVRGSDQFDPIKARGLLAMASEDPRSFAHAVARISNNWQEYRHSDALVQAVVDAATDREAFAVLVEALSRLDATSGLATIVAPTLVLWERGQNLLYKGEYAREIAAAINSARLVITAPNEFGAPDDAFRRACNGFLREVYPAAASPEPAAAPSSLRTILFTDLEGHTAMMSRLGDARGREVLREHEQLMRQALAAHGGQEVKTLGDGFMASFGSAQKALECAIAIERMLSSPDSLAAGEGVGVRVGLNAGEPIAEDGDLFGASVIAAARIAGKARGGQILVADVVRQLAAGKGFLFSDTGEHDLKGLEDPVRIWELRWAES
jgi:class 3 adenylate cyclase/pimeloyl-ACP methyl ester carboxylesterase